MGNAATVAMETTTDSYHRVYGTEVWNLKIVQKQHISLGQGIVNEEL